MKFGKTLQESISLSRKSWENYWIDYKQLKSIVKDCAAIQPNVKLTTETLLDKKKQPDGLDVKCDSSRSIEESMDEKNFFRTLRLQVIKINEFYLKMEMTYKKSVLCLLEEKVGVKDKLVLMAEVVELYKQILLLENYAVMNYCGVSKILKKHDKWTGFDTRGKFLTQIVAKQPFASYHPLRILISKLEVYFHNLTGKSIEDTEDSTLAASTVQQEDEHTSTKQTTENKKRKRSELTKIQSLRDDSFQLKKTESIVDGEEKRIDSPVKQAAAMLHAFKDTPNTTNKVHSKMKFKNILN